MDDPSPLELSTEAYYWKPMAAYFRALELALYRRAELSLALPALDLGCGDGLVADTLAAQRSLLGPPMGVDLALGEVRKARGQRSHAGLAVADALHLPFPDAHFASLFCNGALQAIPDARAALTEAHRVVAPGGTIAITVPTARFDRQLPVANALGTFSARAKRAYLEALADRVSHRHALEVDGWHALLSETGFLVTTTLGFLSTRESRVWNVLSLRVCRLVAVLRLPGVSALRPLWIRIARLALRPLLRSEPVPLDRAGYVLLVATRR